MFDSHDAMATVAVRDLRPARHFYEGVLGLKPLPDSEDSVRVYQSGASQLLVYESAHAGTNQATSATWSVGPDLQNMVKTLKERGVAFEHYSLPGARLEGDIHVFGAMKGAWFKDPDGNILHLVGT